jgi:hypothetical protein
MNQRVNIKFIVENTEIQEKEKPIGFHKILNEDHVMLRTDHAGGI